MLGEKGNHPRSAASSPQAPLKTPVKLETALMIVKHTGQQEAWITLHMFRAAFVFCFFNGIAVVAEALRFCGADFQKTPFHQNVLHLENPRDGEAWWAAVYGVTQSRTRLK